MFICTQMGGKLFAILNEIRGNFAFGSRKQVYCNCSFSFKQSLLVFEYLFQQTVAAAILFKCCLACTSGFQLQLELHKTLPETGLDLLGPAFCCSLETHPSVQTRPTTTQSHWDLQWKWSGMQRWSFRAIERLKKGVT